MHVIKEIQKRNKQLCVSCVLIKVHMLKIAGTFTWLRMMMQSQNSIEFTFFLLLKKN